MAIDRSSETWRAVAEHANSRVNDLLAQLVSSQEHGHSQMIRGQIKVWREVLGLGMAEHEARPHIGMGRDY